MNHDDSHACRLTILCAVLTILCAIYAARAADITSNLVLYYKMDDNAANSTVVDSGPNNQPGTFFNGAAAGNTNLVSVPGQIGTALALLNPAGTTTAVANSIRVNLTQAASNVTNGQSQITICAWVKPDAAATGEREIIEFKSSTGNTRLSLRINGAQMEAGARAIPGDANHLTSGGTITAGVWQHLAMTVNYQSGQQAKLGYLNGTQVINDTSGWGASVAIEAVSGSQTAIIGAQPGGAGSGAPYPARDTIDEVRVYARVLTPQEIVAVMNLKSTWSGAGAPSTSWSTTANWDVNPVSSSGYSLVFPGTTQINANNDISTPFQVSQLTHSNTFAGTNTISSAAGNVLQFTGLGAALTQSGSAALNISCPLDFQSATTIANTGGPLTLSGQLSDSGAVTLTGTGTVIVNNTGTASTNSGLITVSGPTLEVDGATGPAGVTITSGTLRGTAANIGGTVTASGGTISPGVPGSPSTLVSTMTTGGLALSGNGSLTFDLNDVPGGPNNDNIIVNGSFASGGSVNFNFGPGFTGQTFPQTYTLITTTSPPTGATPLIGTITGGAFHVNNIAFVGNSLQVTFGAGASVSATWSTNTTPANWNTAGNWAAGVVPAPGVATTLIFPTLGGFVSTYTANNDIPTTPFVLNLMTLSNSNSGNAITGNAIQFDGGAPAIQQSGSGSFVISTPVSLNAGLTILGGGTGAISLSGPISGNFGISNSNPGVALTLGNPTGNTYTGGTAINTGSLIIANTSGSATGTGSVTLSPNTSLSGTGAVSGAVTLNGVTTLSPGASAGAIGTLATGSLTLNSNTAVNLDLAAPGTNDQITINGNATFAGTLNVTNSGGLMAPGNYTLFTYTGTATDQGFALFAPVTFGYQLPTTGGVVTLTALAAGGTSTWAATGTANFAKPADWDTMPGASATTALSFPTLASAYVANNNMTGLSVNSIALNSTGNLITGNSIGLQGTSPSITQSAVGNFTIGTPIVSNANTTITPVAGATVTLSGAISGTGGIIIPGPGAGTPAAVTMTGGANTFTGATTVTNNALLLLQNATGGIITNGVLGATSAINITGAEVRVNPTVAPTNLDRPIVFGNGAMLHVATALAANLNPAGAWTINALDAAPAILRYHNTNAYALYMGVPALTVNDPVNDTLRLELNDGGANGGVMDFAPGTASTINCKVVFAGVVGGNSSVAEASGNTGKWYMNNGPYVAAASTPGLFFENAMQVVPGNGARILNTNVTITNGVTSMQGRHTGTALDAGTHDLIFTPGRTVTVMNGARLNFDGDFRGNSQGNTGGIALMANTILQDNATFGFLRSDTIQPGLPATAAAPPTHSYRMMVVGSNVTGSGPASTMILNTDTHDGGYNTINTIVTDGVSVATVTTDNPHLFNVGDFVCITHNVDETGAALNPVPALPVASAAGVTPVTGPVAGDFAVTTVPSPTTFTYACTAAATTLSFTTKPVAGIVGVGFANSVMPIGTTNQVCNLVVNGGLVVSSNAAAGSPVGSTQGSATRISHLLTAARLANLTGTAGFLAPKPADVALTIPNGWATTVPVKLLVSHNVTSGADIKLGLNSAFNNDIVVGLAGDSQATLDANGQTIGGTLRGNGTITNNLILGSGANFWPGLATVTAPPLAGDEFLSLTGNISTGVDFSAGGKFKTILTVNAGTVNKETLIVGGGATVVLGGTSVLSLGVGPGDYGNTDILIIQGFSPNIAAPFSSVLGLPAGWAVVYQSGGTDLVGPPSPVNLADSVVIRATSGAVTPVTIGAFAAENDGVGVLLSWDATSEYRNAGFNVYRQFVAPPLGGSATALGIPARLKAGLHTWTRVNPTLIAGRITNPDAMTYRLYDWPAPGVYEYKLESVSVQGAKQSYAELAGPVCVDAPARVASQSEALGSVAALDSSRKASATGALFEAVTSRDRKGAGTVTESSHDPIGLAFDAQGRLLRAASVTAPTMREPGDARSLAVAARSSDAARGAGTGYAAAPVSSAAALRAFTSARPGTSYTAAKITYDAAGVLRVPQAALPAGFDIRRLAIQREGRAMTALALTPDSLILYAPGYTDDYTDKDALFLRATAASTSAGTLTHASGLFTSNEPVNVNTPATAAQTFHDVYFDFDLRPYNYPPWFSSQYLTGGSDQSFTLNAPNATSSAASLTVELWSLTDSDHALQLLVNGRPAGQAQWSGGGKMVQLTFELDMGSILAGANTIDLVTPGSSDQIAFLHSLSLSYTQALIPGT